MTGSTAIGSYDSKTLDRVAKGALCSGCGGCAFVAPDEIRMEQQPPGFLRPRQTAPISADAEALIREICPGVGQSVEAQGRRDDVLWGPYETMVTGHALDEEIRFTASSGGGLSALLLHLVTSGRVDAVVHNAADQDLPVGNVPVISATRAEILHGAGSRYAPSAPLAGLSGLRDDPRRFAFVGKPCDVAAMRALCQRDPAMALKFPVLASFFCAGVPSLKGAEEVLTHLGTTPQNVTAFRYRGHGWPGRATATTRDGETPSMTYHDSWGKILSHHVQHRCKVCADGTGVAADLVCADAWESDENGYPLFEEQDGTSLIVARTALGAEILNEAVKARAVDVQSFDIKDLSSIQPGQYSRRRSLLARLSGLALLGKPIPRYRGLHIRAASRFNGLKANVKNTLGMMRRVIQGRVR